MPLTGFDPPSHGGPIEDSYMDPSYNYALSAGGRFPGDEWFYLEELAARDPELARALDGIRPGSSNPDYEMRGNLDNRRSLTGILARLHEWNVRNTSGIAMSPNPYEGGGQHLYSGPGAPYGPIRGLIDQGTGNFFDGPEMRPPGVSTTEPGPSGGGRGGGRRPYSGPTGPTAPTTQPYQASFLAWQPENAGTPRFVPGTAPAIPPRPAPAPRPNNRNRQGQRPAPAGGGGGGGRGVGSPAPGGPGRPVGGTAAPGGLNTAQLAELLESLLGGRGGPVRAPGANPAATSREGFTGYDTNRIFSQGPGGWLRDPTSGVYDTAGLPGPTMVPPNPGESTDSYMRRLHDIGFSQEEIGRNINSWGQFGGGGMTGEWAGWGTGPVVRGGNGYQFAGQVQGNPNVWGGTGGYPASRNMGDGGGGGGSHGFSEDAASRLLSPFFI